MAEIVFRITVGTGVEQWHGRGERPDIVFVTRPDSTRPVAAVECPELQAAIIHRDAQSLKKARSCVFRAIVNTISGRIVNAIPG